MLTEYNTMCAICNRPSEYTHHLVFGNALRKLADEDKLTVPLCNVCHAELHANTQACELSKILGQTLFEKNQIEKGESASGARMLFRRRYGRSYL